MSLVWNLLGLLLTAAVVENPFYTRCFMAEMVGFEPTRHLIDY